MTKKERFLAALRNKVTDRLVWAPNIDYWFQVNTAENTLPAEFQGMSRNDILCKIDATIWARTSVFHEKYDGVTVKVSSNDDMTRTRWETPVGAVETLEVAAEGKARTKFLKEHRIKKLEDIRTVKYILEATSYVADYKPCLDMMSDVGDNGITLVMAGCVSFIEFCKSEVGWVDGLYMWMDHRNEVESFLKVHEKKLAEMYTVAADSPVPVICTGDNMDEQTMSPALFRQYAIPFYQRMAEILHSKGKIFGGHWCGRTQNLLELAPGSGLDFVEAIVTQPMANLSVTEAMDKLGGEVVMQGGIPAVLLCKEGGSREDVRRYVIETLEAVQNRKGFVLGLGDNVPPNADFERVSMVSGLVDLCLKN